MKQLAEYYKEGFNGYLTMKITDLINDITVIGKINGLGFMNLIKICGLRYEQKDVYLAGLFFPTRLARPSNLNEIQRVEKDLLKRGQL